MTSTDGFRQTIRSEIETRRELAEGTFDHLRRSALAWQKSQCKLPPPDAFGLLENERLGEEARRMAMSLPDYLKGAQRGKA